MLKRIKRYLRVFAAQFSAAPEIETGNWRRRHEFYKQITPSKR